MNDAQFVIFEDGATNRISPIWCDSLPVPRGRMAKNMSRCVIYFSVGFTNSYNHIARATYNCGHQVRVAIALRSFFSWSVVPRQPQFSGCLQ